MSYLVARSLLHARGALAGEVAAGRPAVVMAGGTDLLVRRRGLLRERAVVDVSRGPELREVEVRDGVIRLGAAVTYADCLTQPRIRP